MGRGDAHDRRVQIPKQFLGHQARDLGAPAAQPRIFFDGVEAASLGDFGENRLSVEGNQRTDVNHSCGNAVLCLEFFGSFQRAWHHHPECRDGHIRALATYRSGAERAEMLAVGHLALGSVERFVLKEDNGVRIAYRGREQAFDIGRRRWRHYLEAWYGHRPILDALRMLGSKTRAAAISPATY